MPPDTFRYAGARAVVRSVPTMAAENAARAVELGSWGVDLNCAARRKRLTVAAVGRRYSKIPTHLPGCKSDA